MKHLYREFLKNSFMKGGRENLYVTKQVLQLVIRVEYPFIRAYCISGMLFTCVF